MACIIIIPSFTTGASISDNTFCEFQLSNVMRKYFSTIQSLHDMYVNVFTSIITLLFCNVLSISLKVLFLSRVVDSLSDNDTCNQQSTPLLTLYRKVSFIDKVTQHSERSLALFRKHFREEFQYMIPGNHSEKVINDKLTCIRTKIIHH